MELPDTWIDSALPTKPWYWIKFIWLVAKAKTSRVEIPENLPGKDAIPKYALQPFHNLPNGNYSNRVSQGYITGFDLVMLGEMQKARSKLAADLEGCESVLDMGCAGGHLADALVKSGILDVWALDPSPYLLNHGSKRYPGVKFVQGVIERMSFRDGQFDGAAASFLFHEIPPTHIKRGLKQIFRSLRPGAILTIGEPSRVQFEKSYLRLLRKHGWRGVYFKLIASFIHEPFLKMWHEFDIKSELESAGFKCIEIVESMPITYISAKKP